MCTCRPARCTSEGWSGPSRPTSAGVTAARLRDVPPACSCPATRPAAADAAPTCGAVRRVRVGGPRRDK